MKVVTTPVCELLGIEQPDTFDMQAIRAKLTDSRRTAPLFDTAEFTRDLEAAFVAMWERQQRGEPPAALAVAPSR